MRLGMFPSQQEAFKRALELAREQGAARANRRAFVVATGAFLVGGITGLAIGPFVSSRASRDSGTTTIDAELAMLHQLAMGPLDKLEAAAASLTARIELHGGDPTLWLGYERLALLALASGDRLALARALVAMTKARAVPNALAPLVQRLRETYR